MYWPRRQVWGRTPKPPIASLWWVTLREAVNTGGIRKMLDFRPIFGYTLETIEDVQLIITERQ